MRDLQSRMDRKEKVCKSKKEVDLPRLQRAAVEAKSTMDEAVVGIMEL